MIDAFRAFGAGIWSTARAPGVLVAVFVATLAAVIPFGLVVGRDAQLALSNQPPIDLASEEIDADWWMEYRAHATGLAATFTPAVLGFAAPLDNLSALLDGETRPAALILPLLLYLMVWALLWGGLINRFRERRGSSRAFIVSARRNFTQMLVVSGGATTIALLLYVTVHPVLFGPVFSSLAATASSERDAFLLRVALYAAFTCLLGVVSLAADYTRIGLVAEQQPLRDALRGALGFLGGHKIPVLSLWLLNGVLFLALLLAYGLADRRWGGWRLVMVGQAYICGRLALRVINVASQLRLVEITRKQDAD